ncbi:reverse transcriptase, partial [Phytophthora megakarya]
KITPFRGRLDESENSKQWLRGFVYEMKSTHTPPNEWCMAFQSGLRDGAFSQSAITRYYRAKRSEKEHIRDYLNRLNGYARSVNIKFERSGREAKEHLRDIHTLEDIVSDILKMEKRVSNRSSIQSSPDEYSNDYSNDDPIDVYEGDEADQDECDSDCGSRDEMQVASVHKTMDNSQADLGKVDSDLQLNLDRGSTITAADAGSRDQQMHDFSKCEAFDELAKILRTNVDEKNISPELLKFVFNTGANVSIITTKLARRLQLNPIQEHGRQLQVQGIQEGKMSTTTRVKAKVTLGWNTVYEFEFWVMDHSAGSEVVLGTDFMIPAGIRLDLFNATAKLPGEEIVPLVKSLSADEDSAEGMHVTGGPTMSLQIPAGEWIEFRLQKRKPSLGTHGVWVQRTAALIPTIVWFRKAQPTLVRVTNITDKDYAQELAFLPDLTKPSVTELDYTAPNVKNPSFVGGQQRRLDKGMQIPLRHLQKLYELLKGLLKAGLIAFSDSPWASPIVIVLEKNGQGIRLCIDYKMVNAVTAIMEYAMPLVDDLLTELENYLWFCSLDAASGFWTIMMTMRARKISAFVCALGHFEWLRTPFGLKNAPMIYQRMIDNALCGFVQPKGGWERYAERMKLAEEAAKHQRSLDDYSDFTQTTTRTKFEANRQASSELDPVLRMVNDPYADMFATNEPDESSLVPVFQRRSFVDDICFGGTTFDDCLDTLDKLLARFEECRISVSFTKSFFCQSKVDFLSHEVAPEGIRADPKKMTAITNRFIQDFAVYEAALYQLKEDDFSEGGDLAAAEFTALQRRVAEAPILRHFDAKKEVHITLYTNEWALILKDAEMNYHSAEKEVLALLLLLKLKSVRYLHVVREYNAAADSLAGEALESKMSKVVLNDHRKTEPKKLNRIKEMIYEPAEVRHELTADGIDPITVQEERRRRIAKAQDEELRWSNLKAVVRGETTAMTYKEAREAWKWADNFVLSSDNVLSSKQLKGYSPGNVLAERPFQCSFTEFVIANAMSDTDALTVTKVFEECIYRRFGAPSLIRHDRDPRCMSEQERSVKTVMQSVKDYVKDPLQQDWDEIAERLVFAINNSHDMTTILLGIGKQTEALAWRREINRQQQIALEMAKEYQAVEKDRRARIHNEKLSRKEQAAVPKGVNDGSPDDDSDPKVKRKVEEFAYELELPDKTRDVAEEARYDFDEERLPEDSWMPDEVTGEFEVEAILDDRTPMSTNTDRPVREFEVKWVGCESTTWEPASNLSYGGLLYDYLRNKKSEQRLQMVQVADED